MYIIIIFISSSISNVHRGTSSVDYITIYIHIQHPYCCVNNIVLTLFLKQSTFDVLICSLNLFHSHGAS